MLIIITVPVVPPTFHDEWSGWMEHGRSTINKEDRVARYRSGLINEIVRRSEAPISRHTIYRWLISLACYLNVISEEF